MTAPENIRERLAEALCSSCGHLVQWHHVSGGLPCACWPGGGEDRCSCRSTFADALLPLIDALLREKAATAWDEGAITALDFATRDDDGINLSLDLAAHPNPYRTFGGER